LIYHTVKKRKTTEDKIFNDIIDSIINNEDNVKIENIRKNNQ